MNESSNELSEPTNQNQNEIYEKAVEALKQFLFARAENLFISLIPQISTDDDLYPKVVSKLFLVMYINTSKTENATNLVLNKIKTFPNINTYWEKSIMQVAIDVPVYYYKCIRFLTVDFFVKLNPFHYFILNADKSNFDSLVIYIDITKQCASKLDSQLLVQIALVFFERVKQIFDNIDSNELRTIDEKKLRQCLKWLRDINPSREFINHLDQFDSDIMFMFCKSSNLSKEYDGLVRFNEVRSLKPYLERIKKDDIVKQLLKNMHESIVGEFSKFISKLFDIGYFDSQILADFWNISINQHVTVIDKFFEGWMRILIHIPVKNLSQFWTIVMQSKFFPPASLKFLSQIKNKASAATKTELTLILWNAMENSQNNQFDFVPTIADYTTLNSSQWISIKNKCFDYISSGKNVGVVVSLLNRIWCSVDPDTTQQELDIILEYGKFDVSSICILFDLIKKMISGLKRYLTDVEITQLKPLILIFLEVANDDFVKKFVLDFSQHITDVSSNEIIEWLCKLPKVDRCIFFTIQILFNQLNKIRQTQIYMTSTNHAYSNGTLAGVPSNIMANININSTLSYSSSISSLKNLNGIKPIWKLLFTSDLRSIPLFLSSLASQCSDKSSASFFVSKCMKHIDTVGAISALHFFVNKIEESFDLDSYGIKRNLFLLPDSFITVYLTGDLNQILKIYCNTTTAGFISKVARLLHVSESAIVIFYEHEKLQPNHIFKADQKFNVQREAMTPPIREWNVLKGELPSQLIKPYFSQIYNLLDSENSSGDNKTISDYALRLLNFIQTDETEFKKIKMVLNQDPGWNTLLDPNQPYHIVYRLNIIGNCLLLNDRLFEKAFFENGGFRRILDVLFISNKIFVQSSSIRLIIEITKILLKIANNSNESDPQIKKIKDDVLKEIGSNQLPEFIDWIIEIIKKTNQSNITLNILINLLEILLEIIRLNHIILPTLRNFPDLVFLTIFHDNSLVRTSVMNIILELDPKSYKDVIFSNIEKSIYGNSTEYFILMNQVAKKSDDPTMIWNKLVNFIMSHLLLINEHSIPTDDQAYLNDKDNLIKIEIQRNEETLTSTQYESQIRDLCSFAAKPDFIEGIFEVMCSLLFLIDKIPNLNEFITFVIEKIIFNNVRFIHTPNSLFNLIQHAILKDFNLIKIVIEKLEYFHNICNPVPPIDILTTNFKPKGINNMGATCYLNSSLQQVLRIDEVKNSLFKYRNDEIPIDEDWVAQLQLLAAKLIYSPLASVDASKFVGLWKGWDDMPIDPREQQDAGEFLQMLLDRLDEKLDRKPVTKAVIGQYEQKIVQIGGPYRNESISDFTVLPLQVKDHSNFKESFKTFLEPDNLTGNDKYSVENLGQIDAERFNTIHKAPENLIILLKRFEFDLETLSSKKVNSYFQFTKTLDISSIMSKNSNTDVGEYELTGIIMHSGYAVGGHYYSYIKDEDIDFSKPINNPLIDKSWNCYNDASVYPLEPNFMEKCFGGKQLLSNSDPLKRHQPNEIVDRIESAYLLFYKQISRKIEKVEPINLLPQNALKYLLKDIEQMIIKNMFFSEDYLNFISFFIDLPAICNTSPEEAHKFAEVIDGDNKLNDFLINTSIKLLNYPIVLSSVNKYCGKINSRLINDVKFSEFFLSKSKEIIEFLLTNSSESMRIRMLYLVNSALSKVSKEISFNFINKIVSNIETFLPYWRNFDQIFRPVLFYVNNIDSSNEEILENIVSFLEKSYSYKISNSFDDTKNASESNGKPINNNEFDNFASFVNLSSIFQIIMKLVISLNKINDYLPRINNSTLFSLILKSPKHTYDISLLILSLQKNNIVTTNEFLKSISTNRDITPKALAAYFAAAISLEDTLTNDRIKHFLSFIKMKSSNKWSSDQLALFFNETSRILNMNRELPLDTIHSIPSWISYLLSYDSNLRKSVVDFSKAIFRTISSLSTLYDILLHELPICIKKCITNATSIRSSDQFPTSQYFELFQWTVLSGKLHKNIITNKDIFIKSFIELGNLNSPIRSPIYDFVTFLRKCIETNFIPSFFDNQTLSSFINSLSNLPNDIQPYIENIMPDVAYFITQIIDKKGNHDPNGMHPTFDFVLVVKSQIFKYALKDMLYEHSPLMKFFELMLTKTTAITIATILFDNNILEKNLCLNFIQRIMKTNQETTDIIFNSNFPNIIVNNLINKFENRLSISNYQPLIMNIETLYIFSKLFINQFKGKRTWLLTSKLTPFNNFWVSNSKFISHLFEWIQMSSVPPEFARSIILFISTIYTNNPKLAQNAFKLLKSKHSHFFKKIHKNIIPDYLQFSFNVCNSYVVDYPLDVFVISAKDLINLIKTDFYDANEIALLSKIIIKCLDQNNYNQNDLHCLVVAYGTIFMNADNMKYFSGYISQAAFQISVDAHEFQSIIPDWVFFCSKLIGISLVNKKLNELIIAKEFVETGKNISGCDLVINNIEVQTIDSLIDNVKNDPNPSKEILDALVYFKKMIPK